MITPKTNWKAGDILIPSDLNRIESNILEIYNNVATGKQNLYNAIVSKGVTPGSKDFADLVNAVSQIILGRGTAAQSDVLQGKTFTNNSGVELPGTMPDLAGDTAAIASSVSGTTLKLRPPKGYKDGVDDNVTITDPNFIAQNIVSGKSIFGLTGTNTNKKWTKGIIASISATEGQVFFTTQLDFIPKTVLVMATDSSLQRNSCVTIEDGTTREAYFSNISVAKWRITGTTTLQLELQYYSGGTRTLTNVLWMAFE